jgi:hypothetical protein
MSAMYAFMHPALSRDQDRLTPQVATMADGDAIDTGREAELRKIDAIGKTRRDHDPVLFTAHVCQHNELVAWVYKEMIDL